MEHVSEMYDLSIEVYLSTNGSQGILYVQSKRPIGKLANDGCDFLIREPVTVSEI